MDAKWGLSCTSMSGTLGDHQVLKIGAFQFVLIATLLIVVRPRMILFRRGKLNTSEIDLLKVAFFSGIVSLGTFCLPLYRGSANQ